MDEQQKHQAEHLALENFRRWSEITGVPPEGTSWYFELECIIKDAVDIGAKTALGEPVDLDDYLG